MGGRSVKVALVMVWPMPVFVAILPALARERVLPAGRILRSLTLQCRAVALAMAHTKKKEAACGEHNPTGESLVSIDEPARPMCKGSRPAGAVGLCGWQNVRRGTIDSQCVLWLVERRRTGRREERQMLSTFWLCGWKTGRRLVIRMQWG